MLVRCSSCCRRRMAATTELSESSGFEVFNRGLFFFLASASDSPSESGNPWLLTSSSSSVSGLALSRMRFREGDMLLRGGLS